MNKIKFQYNILRKKYGKPAGQWMLWGKRPKTFEEKEEIIIGAILTQQTNWNNVMRALENFKNEKCLSLARIYKLGKRDKNKLKELIKPSGFYNQKTEYLLNLVNFIIEKYKTLDNMEKVPADILREELLKIKGIGEETADSILLYAMEKPVFVIDEYTRRFCKENKITDVRSYSYLQKLFSDNLPKNYKLYQDYHALIVIDGKNS
ncbi:MAG: endonuclease [bacterium]